MVVSRSLLVGQIKDDDLIRKENEKDESTFYLGHTGSSDEYILTLHI